jgi:farnesyl-diphosphate farnesyltransferase
MTILETAEMSSEVDFDRVLQETSRTFALPIRRLPKPLRQAVAAAYLCMRALDEIEDHPLLPSQEKAVLLQDISRTLQAQIGLLSPSRILSELELTLTPYWQHLPEVSRRLGDWLSHAPSGISARILDATAAMADRMAYWAGRGWSIHSEADLNGYTFSVAGSVGLLLCDIWAWFDQSQLDRIAAVQFGRALQVVNIIRNRPEDLERGADYFPDGWSRADMIAYARRMLNTVKAGAESMPGRAYKYLVEIPLLLADATLDAIENGQAKVSRARVLRIIAQTS